MLSMNYTTTEFTEELDSTLKFATFNFDAGAGEFNISKTTNNLIAATAEGIKNNFNLTRFDTDSSHTIDLKMRQKSIFRFGDNYKNTVDINFNPKTSLGYEF